MRHSWSHSTNSTSCGVKLPKQRTVSAARSAGTHTYMPPVALISIPAASGRHTGILLGVAGASTFFGRAGAFDGFALWDFCLFFIKEMTVGHRLRRRKRGGTSQTRSSPDWP